MYPDAFKFAAHEALHRGTSLDCAEPASGGPPRKAGVREECDGKHWIRSSSTLNLPLPFVQRDTNIQFLELFYITAYMDQESDAKTLLCCDGTSCRTCLYT